MFGFIHSIDREKYIESTSFGLDSLSRLGVTFGEDGLCLRIPPAVVILRLGEKLPDVIEWGIDNINWTDINAHKQFISSVYQFFHAQFLPDKFSRNFNRLKGSFRIFLLSRNSRIADMYRITFQCD